MPWKLNWGALSLARRVWQSMRLVVAAGLILAGTPAVAAAVGQATTPPPGGKLLMLKLGRYVCELPGDALGDIGIHQPREDFSVERASLYDAPLGRGSYLRWAATVEMTSGPKAGERFRVVTPNQLRKLNPDGSDATLRCIRQVLNNDADFSAG